MSPALGGLVRAWRGRLDPVQLGLGGRARRVPGLRREDLAELAGLSVDYVTRLEQGRARHPSPVVLDALARALRLSGAEREVLYRSAGRLAPTAGTVVPRYVSPGTQRVLDRLADVPAAVFSAAWDLLHWNSMWAALIGDPSSRPGRGRNHVWLYFSDPASVVEHHDGAVHRFENEMVSDLRLARLTYPDDGDLHDLCRDLYALNRRFAALWDKFSIQARTSTRKTLHHRLLGDISVDCDVFVAPGDNQRLVVYTVESGSDDASKLDLLRVTGSEQFP